MELKINRMKESLETTTAEAESEEEKQSLIDRQTVVADQVVATLAVEEYLLGFGSCSLHVKLR